MKRNSTQTLACPPAGRSWGGRQKGVIFQIAGGCRGACLMYNSNFPHVPFGTFRND
jgi:hypothetical protein